jgi:hypothetical protein
MAMDGLIGTSILDLLVSFLWVSSDILLLVSSVIAPYLALDSARMPAVYSLGIITESFFLSV